MKSGPSGVGTRAWSRPAGLLAAAAAFHAAVTIALLGVGRAALFPLAIDTNGITVALTPDSLLYRADALSLSERLTSGGMLAWLTASEPLAIKLFSLSLALVGRWAGVTILGAEPINALSYLAILLLVFILGRDAFNPRAGLLAAGTVGLWPSFLLHSTQFLKDSLFAGGLLALVVVISRLLSRAYSWRGALTAGAGGGLLAVLLSFSRDNMADVVVATALIGAGLFLVRQVQDHRAQATNIIGIALLTAITVGATRVLPESHERPHAAAAAAAASAPQPALAWWDVAARVARVRGRFLERYRDAGSNIDDQVPLTGMGDLVGYLPRAAAIGFLAPFPDMWTTTGGRVGLTARRLSGLESVAMYAVYVVAVAGLWRGRRRIAVWLLSSVAATGLTALGLVVVNVGALYRLRYVFLCLVITIAAGGATGLAPDQTRR
ncbi:MAG: hypothetical protein ABUS56_03855 [Acidobacteriota bacterium]